MFHPLTHTYLDDPFLKQVTCYVNVLLDFKNLLEKFPILPFSIWTANALTNPNDVVCF